ncbi:ABC transporter ATP-binding protein [Fusobacterium sp. oral taxon 370]|uniref:ABC transporter ATP-binding protein n=1 Tax=Fusobacterium sp. oral taxon 370 TaxID=712288 RepID=UPI00030FCBA4|nr:ABC transporter ATP-binding protein [Fusobacterium sp. oral taxon 370]
MLKKFISYYKPHKKMFFLDLLAAFLISICDLFYPILTRSILYDFIPNKKLKTIFLFLFILALIYIFKMLSNYFVGYYGHIVGVKIQADMRRDLFKHIQNMPISYFDKNQTGDIMSRIVNDLVDISELAHHGPEDVFISGILVLGSFCYLINLNVLLTCIVFFFVPILALLTISLRKRMMRAFAETRTTVGAINANLSNSISGIRVSKSFNNSKFEFKKFEEGNSKYILARKAAYFWLAVFQGGVYYIIDVLYLVMLLSGTLFTYYNKITVVDFVTYMLFVNLLITPIKRLINSVEQFQNGMSGFRRFYEIITVPQEEDGKIEVGKLKGNIVFDRVTFRYEENENIFENFSLNIKAGTNIALVGESGVGKSTICHLIPRFYEVISGKITIDGIDIKEMTLSSLRKNIGIVTQDVFLFTGTIKENIAYGKLDATDEEIYRAAKYANIHDYIITLEKGYDTQVGERGIRLSGGQKQRISIARVFLANPPILILDEATSALDSITERNIQKSLDELSEGRTTLVVAHRLTTIRKADVIIVITKDGITEMGNHDELMKLEGIYYKLNQV